MELEGFIALVHPDSGKAPMIHSNFLN